MHIINRSAVTLTYKKPFIDWHNKLMPLSESLIGESSTYLIQEISGNPVDAIKKYYLEIFETELFQMWTDEKDWPRKITFKLFEEWFSVEISGWVYDLDKKKLGRSEFDM